MPLGRGRFRISIPDPSLGRALAGDPDDKESKTTQVISQAINPHKSIDNELWYFQRPLLGLSENSAQWRESQEIEAPN